MTHACWIPLRSCCPYLCNDAGVLLYMVDLAFRVLQQAQPVHITRCDASADGSLVTVHFRAGPFTPIHAIQVPPAWAPWAHPAAAYRQNS